MNRNFLCLRNKYFFFRKSITKINYLNIILIGMLSGTPLASLAENIDLVCVHTDGFSINFAIDTSKPSVTYSGIDAYNVLIEPGSFSFTLDLKSSSYFHMINRSTGSLAVRGPDGKFAVGYKCDRAKPKF